MLRQSIDVQLHRNALLRGFLASLPSQLCPIGSPQQSVSGVYFNAQASGICAIRCSAAGVDQHAIIRAVPVKREAIKAESDPEANFRKWMQEWKNDRHATSCSIEIVMHPSYQRIISLGRTAIPWILSELQKDVDHWFWALRVISGVDPVPAKSRGKTQEMAQAWLQWGRTQGHV